MSSTSSSPEEDALALLLERYRRAHSEYRDARGALNLLHGGGLLVGPFLLLCLLISTIWPDWLGPRTDPDDPSTIASLLFVTAVFCGIGANVLWQRRQSKRRIQSAKNDLDLVEYIVVCDQRRDVFNPRLLLTNAPPAEGMSVAFARFKPIDFAQYDRVFRIIE